MSIRVELNALFVNAHLKLIASLDNAIHALDLAIEGQFVLGKETLVLVWRLNNFNLVVSAEECAKLVLPIFEESGVGLDFRVAVVGVVVVAHSFAARAVANKTHESIANASLLHVIFVVGKLGVNDNIGSEGD